LTGDAASLLTREEGAINSRIVMDSPSVPGPSPTLDIASLAAALRSDLDFKDGVPEAAQQQLRPGMLALWRKAKEAAPLANAEIVVLVEQTSDSEMPSPFTRAELLAFGQACAPLVGRRLGLVARSLRVNVLILSRTAISDSERTALKSLRITTPSVTLGEAFHVDVTSGSWWSTVLVPTTEGEAETRMFVPDGETFSLASWLSATLAGHVGEAARSAALLKSPSGVESFKELGASCPATLALLVLLSLIYLAEAWSAHSFWDIEVSALQTLGGVSGPAVFQDHQIYRLLSATLLHGGMLHLLFNGVALLLGGALLEAMVGSGWMLLVYVVSGVCGSLLGIFLNPPNVVSVGASGAIMGVLAAAFVTTFRMPVGRERAQAQAQVTRFLVPSLLPLATSASAGKVDYAAHLGGVAGGLMIGLCMVLFWHSESQRPRFRAVAAGLALVGCLLLSGSGLAAVKHAAPFLDELSLQSKDVLVDDRDIPKGTEAAETVDTWGKDKPRDPRVHLYRGLRAINHDNAEAERELRLSFADKAILHRFFGDGKFEGFARSILCDFLLDLGRHADAITEARPICGDPQSSEFAHVTELGLCR